MELQAPLDAFAREQRAGLGALVRLSRLGDRELPEGGGWDPPWDQQAGDWDPRAGDSGPRAGDWDPRWADDDPPYAEEPDIPDVSQRSLGRWR